MLELLYCGQNVHSLSVDDRVRKAKLAALRDAFEIVGASETWAKPEDEAIWQRDWGAGHVFWSSNTDDTRSKGVALFVKDTVLLEGVRVHKGQGHGYDGRFLAVEADVFKK